MVLLLTPFPVRSLFMMNADGSGRQRILTMSDNTSPARPTGRTTARRSLFDAWKSIYGEGVGDAHMLVVNVDGSGRKDLGPGYMPCWSLDDKQLAYSSHGPEQGICIMNADGSDRRCIDPEGWGAKWSPKRNEIAYTVYKNGRADLCIYDVGKRQRRALLDRDYQQIYHQLTWSPDGDWLCLRRHPARRGRGDRRRQPCGREARLQDSRAGVGDRHLRQRGRRAGLGRQRKPDRVHRPVKGKPHQSDVRGQFQGRQTAVVSRTSRRLEHRHFGMVARWQEDRLFRLPGRGTWSVETSSAEALTFPIMASGRSRRTKVSQSRRTAEWLLPSRRLAHAGCTAQAQ